jgi:hypothetical protein
MALNVRRLIASLGFVGLALWGGPSTAQERPSSAPSGRIKIEEVQVAFLASGALGGGTLTYNGKSYPLKIGGLGVGGVGASRLSASGNVYGLTRLSDFSGAYVAVRSGWALGDRGKGRMWLRNANGVILNLSGSRKGLQTALGAEGVVIQLK